MNRKVVKVRWKTVPYDKIREAVKSKPAVENEKRIRQNTPTNKKFIPGSIYCPFNRVVGRGSLFLPIQHLKRI